MSSFETFMTDTIAEDGDTRLALLPVGDYFAALDGQEPKDVYQERSGTRNDGSDWFMFNVVFKVTGPEGYAVDENIRFPRTIRQAYFIELDENNKFNPHSNTKFCNLLKAAGAPTTTDGKVKLAGSNLEDILSSTLGQEVIVRVGIQQNEKTGATYNTIQRVIAK